MEEKRTFYRNYLSRVMVNQETNVFTNISLKTFISNNTAYSYLEFHTGSGEDYNQFGVDFYELNRLIMVLDKNYNQVVSKSAEIRNPQNLNVSYLSQFNMQHTCDSNFKNAQISVSYQVGNDGKLKITLFYNSPSEDKVFTFASLTFLQYKNFIDVLTTLKNTWFNIQTSNIILFNMNNSEIPAKVEDASTSNYTVTEVPVSVAPQPVQPQPTVVEDNKLDLPPWEIEEDDKVPLSPQNPTGVASNLMSGIGDFKKREVDFTSMVNEPDGNNSNTGGTTSTNRDSSWEF